MKCEGRVSDAMLLRLRPRSIEPRAVVPAASAVVSPVLRSNPEADAALCGRGRAEDALACSNLSMTDVTNSCSDSSAAPKTTKRSSMASRASRAHGSDRVMANSSSTVAASCADARINLAMLWARARVTIVARVTLGEVAWCA